MYFSRPFSIPYPQDYSFVGTYLQLQLSIKDWIADTRFPVNVSKRFGLGLIQDKDIVEPTIKNNFLFLYLFDYLACKTRQYQSRTKFKSWDTHHHLWFGTQKSDVHTIFVIQTSQIQAGAIIMLGRITKTLQLDLCSILNDSVSTNRKIIK